jgi:endonuclease G
MGAAQAQRVRFLVLFIAFSALGCGPQVAFIDGEELDPPARVGQPVQPAVKVVGTYQPPRNAPQMNPAGVFMDSFGLFAPSVETVDAGQLDAGEADGGTSDLVDAGTTSETPDAGETSTTAGADAGAESADAGVAEETPGPTDAGAVPTPDAGSSSVSADAGVAQETPGPTDAGAENAVPPPDASSGGADAGAPPHDAGTPWDGGTNGLAVSVHLALGVPDDSGVGATDRWLLVRPQLVTSYDTTRKVPRWSSWALDTTHFGPATRATSFRMDPLLPSSAPQARDSDYVNSGFDRGHLCPSADRTATDADNDATFFLTNVVPQTHTSNAGPWLDLEDEARTIARTGKRLVIIAGPIFGVTRQVIGTGVEVPLSMFKVAVVLDGAYGPASATSTTKVYAAIVPNASVLSGAWRTYQVTVDEVERQTGLDFLSDLEPSLQAQLEDRLSP